MLLLLITILLAMEALFLVIKRDRKSLLVFLSSLSLFTFIFGILLYIAKKGGITATTSLLLFGPDPVRRFLQYRVLTLGMLGYIVAVGRFLFPFFILLSAFSFSYFPLALRIKRLWWMLLVIPLVSLIIYIPGIFKPVIAGNAVAMKAVVYASRIWIYLYAAAALAVMVHEYRSITSSFFRRRFITKIMILSSLTIVYLLYAEQDPAQIYLFYSNDYMWNLGLLYLTPGISDGLYAAVMSLSFIASAVGCYGTLRYIRVILDDEHEEIDLKEKAHEASLGVSMFIHGTKNELLSSRILISRMEKSGCHGKELMELRDINEKLLMRMERLRASVARNSVHLDACPLSAILSGAVEKARSLCPGIRIDVADDGGIIILADPENLSEAISNIIVNGWEATVSMGRLDPVRIEVRLERLWVSVSVEDRGSGIPKEAYSHIWEPFYSSKNSSSNWGMGMYFSRRIIRMHLGTVRFETKMGEGTRFMLLFPRYDRKDDGSWPD